MDNLYNADIFEKAELLLRWKVRLFFLAFMRE